MGSNQIICISLFRLCFLVGVASIFWSPATAKRLNIIVNAGATEEYIEQSKELPYQTYHFIKGDFHGGSFRDKGLEEAKFEEIAESLAVALKKRKYYPEPDKQLGDLMIMISYGKTSLDPNPTKNMGVVAADELKTDDQRDREAGSGGEASFFEPDVNSLGASIFRNDLTNYKNRNIALLGFAKDLGAVYNTEIGRDELWKALEVERYFVIVNAFDYQFLRKHGKLKEVWSVRYSTRSRGVGFADAYKSMNEAVSGVFGLQIDKLSKVKGDTEGNVTFGELEVESYEDSEE